VRLRDVRDVCSAGERTSRARTHLQAFPLGHWDSRTYKTGDSMIDLKEQAGIAMNVRGQFSDPISDPQVTLGALAFANELGRLLWRMKYGQDVKRSGLHRACLLLANRMRDGRRFDRSKFTGITRAAKQAALRSGVPLKLIERETADVIDRFARRAIVEWVADQCAACDGRGVVGRGEQVSEQHAVCPTCSGAGEVCVDEYRIPFAARRDGSGPIVYRDRERCDTCVGLGHVTVKTSGQRRGRQICPACQGTARAAVDHAARAIALGVTAAQYRAHWERQFVGVLALLDAVDGAASDTMQRKLQR
jgi:hypothetical protein